MQSLNGIFINTDFMLIHRLIVYRCFTHITPTFYLYETMQIQKTCHGAISSKHFRLLHNKLSHFFV